MYISLCFLSCVDLVEVHLGHSPLTITVNIFNSCAEQVSTKNTVKEGAATD